MWDCTGGWPGLSGNVLRRMKCLMMKCDKIVLYVTYVITDSLSTGLNANERCHCASISDATRNPVPLQGVTVPFVTKWIDYSNKYGFGFQLSDNSVGALFNDTTRMGLSADRT